MSNKDKWSALSMIERADFIKKSVREGIFDRKSIIDNYNSFATGGNTDGEEGDMEPAVVVADYPREEEVWKRADSSSADIVRRLKEGASREVIRDWKDTSKIATHKMMSAGNLAVGNIQNIDGLLVDFTDPKYGFEYPEREAIGNAVRRGDFIEFDTEGDARYFAEHYKKHYPDMVYHKKSLGGRLLSGDGQVQTLSGLPVRRDTLPFKGAFNPEDTMFWSPSESARVDSTTPLVLAREEVVATPSQEDIDNILNGPKYSVPKGNAENAFVRKANEIIRDKTESDLRKELNSKNEDEIREVQRSLANEGYFDIDLTVGKSSNAEGIQKMLVKEGYLKRSEVDGNIGSHTTEMLQKMLVDKGYLPEFTESGKSNIDGDIGKRTREAFKQFNRDYNVDGIAGEKTTAGYLAKEGKKSLGFNMKVSAEGMVDQCAAWVSKKYDSVVGESKQNGVYGSAWNMLKNVEDSGGQMLFNAYDSPYFDNVKDASGIKKGVVEYMKSNPIDYSILEAGDVVGIHNPSSTHYGDALKEGTTYNTHVGIVVGVENGVPIVEHNILGKVRRERIDKLTGSAFGQPTVTVASRPKKGAPLEGQLEFNDVKSKIELPSKPNEQMSEYMDSVASSKETFGKIYKDVDMDFIEKAAIAITKRETGFMTNKQSDVLKGESGIMSMAAAAARKAAHWWRDTPEEVMSQDLTKMKFASLGSQYRKAIGLETPDQLSTDPTITGRAVTLLLSKNYDYFQRLAKKHPELGLTKEDIQNATIWSYNVGLGALASLGFEGSGEYKGEVRPKEIERLRAISQPGYKEKDIRATNWKHLGALGEYMYDNFGDPHTPYVAAANETIARLGTKMMYGGTKSTFKSIAERNAKILSKTLK